VSQPEVFYTWCVSLHLRVTHTAWSKRGVRTGRCLEHCVGRYSRYWHHSEKRGSGVLPTG